MAGGLRQPKYCCTAQYEIDGGFQAQAVTNGDINRPGTLAGAKCCSNYLFMVDQRLPVAALRADCGMLANQKRLGRTNRRKVADQAQMGSQAETARVSETVTIAYQQIGERL